jgi:hypothetical protein
MKKTTKQNSPIKVGYYVKWNDDSAIHELIKVDGPYFIDCDWFHLEDKKWHSDLGYEISIDDLHCDTIEEVKSAIKYILEAMRELGELNDNEIVMFSAVKGVYDFKSKSWRCPYISENRENYIVYKYFNATKELADKYGIVADEYAE